jgi:hypothetical protein
MKGQRDVFKRIFAPTEKLAPADKLAPCYNWRLGAKLAPSLPLKNCPQKPFKGSSFWKGCKMKKKEKENPFHFGAHFKSR